MKEIRNRRDIVDEIRDQLNHSPVSGEDEWRIADFLPMDLGFDHGPADRPWNVELWGPRPSKDLRLVPKSRLAVDQILDDLRAEIDRQDRKHGPYERQSRLGVSRLALATLEDEVAEAKDAWREERRMSDWPHTREEVLQVAAVAVRTLRDALATQEVDRG